MFMQPTNTKNIKITEMIKSGNLKNKVLENIEAKNLLRLTEFFINENYHTHEMDEIIYEIYPDLPKLDNETIIPIMDVVCSYLAQFLIEMKFDDSNSLIQKTWVESKKR